MLPEKPSNWRVRTGWIYPGLPKSPGVNDDMLVELALAENRVLLTMDKDLGEMAFRRGRNAIRGVMLLPPRLRAPEHVAAFMLSVLNQSIEWEGRFCVALEGQVLVVPLPEPKATS